MKGNRGTGTSAKYLRSDIGVWVVRVFMCIYSVIVLYPILWAVFCSVKDNASLFDNIFELPSELHFENYVNAWTKAHISQYFLNTVVITIGSLALMMLFASMASYVIARYDFLGRRVFRFLYISGMMIPGTAGIVPLFIELSSFGMVDNRVALMLVNCVNMMAFSVFILISFFKTIPKEISEAATVDGCGRFKLFGRVMLPLAQPGLIPVLIIQFISCWSEVYYSMILLSTDSKKTLQIGLYNMQKVQFQRADYVVMFAASVLVALPSILMYIIFQKKIIGGISMGAVKG